MPARRLFSITWTASLGQATSPAQQPVQSAPTEFIVLRTERVDVPVGETTHLNCSVVGSGDAAQISCESQTSGCESETSGSGPYGSSPCRLGTGLGRGLGTRVSVYHVALVVGSNHVGYVVYCGGGGLLRKGCQPLSTGQVLKGSVKGDGLSVFLSTKTKTYTVETSAYIGPCTRNPSPNESTASPKTEGHPAYNFNLTQYRGAQRSRIKHKDKTYVRGEVHTNSIESAFSLFKRGLIGASTSSR